MKPKIYKFDKKVGSLGKTSYQVTDYFQYYTTGIEDLPGAEQLYVTQRRDNERYEVLAWNIFNDENLADLLLGLNNDVFLWATPSDNNSFQEQVDITYDYLQKKNKTRFPNEDVELWKQIAYDIVEYNDDKLRNVIIPRTEFLQKISRTFKDSFQNRTVE